MEKHSITINDKLYEQIKDYCLLNNLKINKFAEGLLSKSFLIEKYGDTPFPLVRNVIREEAITNEEKEVEQPNVEVGKTEVPELVKLKPEEIPTMVIVLPEQKEDTRTVEEVFQETLDDFKQTNDKPKKRRLK